jgi:hypothetical protein
MVDGDEHAFAEYDAKTCQQAIRYRKQVCQDWVKECDAGFLACTIGQGASRKPGDVRCRLESLHHTLKHEVAV